MTNITTNQETRNDGVTGKEQIIQKALSMYVPQIQKTQKGENINVELFFKQNRNVDYCIEEYFEEGANDEIEISDKYVSYAGFNIKIRPGLIDDLAYKHVDENEDFSWCRNQQEYDDARIEAKEEYINSYSTEHIVWEDFHDSWCFLAIENFDSYQTNNTKKGSKRTVAESGLEGSLLMLMLGEGFHSDVCDTAAVSFLTTQNITHYIPLIMGFIVTCCVVWHGMIKPIIQGRHTSKYTIPFRDNPVEINTNSSRIQNQ